MKAFQPFTFGLFGIAFHQAVHACLWDSDTLAQEKSKSPSMAEAILGKSPQLGDPVQLRERIAKLEANRQENDAAWWNDLAGAHIRLGAPKVAVELLESVTGRFPDDYGVHANLGTAYHLLGRYQEAAKEIARDLEINPDAHFGLEKYHLALLQYLVRDAKYQARHVYVDEFSVSFLKAGGPILFLEPAQKPVMTDNPLVTSLAALEEQYDRISKTNRADTLLRTLLIEIVTRDEPPAYRTKWNLAEDPKLRDGPIYMASLNPKEPACFVMLGILSWRDRDLNLAVAAFENAISLGSPQAELLKQKVESIKTHVEEAKKHKRGHRRLFFAATLAIGCTLTLFFVMLKRLFR